MTGIDWGTYTAGHYRLTADRQVERVHINSEADLFEWARDVWGDDGKRRVAFTEIAPGVEVSTVFLGLDHRFCGKGPPLVFETMVFDDYGSSDTMRWCTWDEALAGHKLAVRGLERSLKQATRKTLSIKSKS